MIYMNPKKTYVMPEPHVRIVDGNFRFIGEAKPVNVNVNRRNNILDYLRAAGAYNSQADVNDGYCPVRFDDYFRPAKEELEKVDDVMSLLDERRLKADLDKNGYAFLMARGNAGRFQNHQGTQKIANLNRGIQDLIFQRISKELNQDVRHLKTQESVELMLSDKAYKENTNYFWTPNAEIIQVLEEQPVSSYSFKDGKLDAIDAEILTPLKASSVLSFWNRDEARPTLMAHSPLLGLDRSVAVLKKSSEKK